MRAFNAELVILNCSMMHRNRKNSLLPSLFVILEEDVKTKVVAELNVAAIFRLKSHIEQENTQYM